MQNFPTHLSRVVFHPELYPTDIHYPFALPLFRRTRDIAFTTPITLFVGENGTGKSTLLEAIARRCGIHIWENPCLRRMKNNPYEDRLYQYISVEWRNGIVPGSFFGSTVFQDFVHLLEDWATTDPGQINLFGGKSLMTLSHGQSIMAYFKSRYRIEGLYLMDEPETALSPATQLKLLQLLTQMGGAGHAQFVIATHSPILLSCPGATLLTFDRVPIAPIHYKDTDHFRIYEAFMADPTKYHSG